MKEFNYKEFYVKTIELQRADYQKLVEVQDQLVSQTQMHSFKILSGDVAHDFNNLLMAITSNLEFLKMSDLPEDALASIDDISKASESAMHFTNQLLQIAKGDNGVNIHGIVDLNQCISEVGQLISKGRDIRLDYDLTPDLWDVIGNVFQLKQVFQNLIINACEASENGDKIVLQSENVVIDGNNSLSLPSGRYVKAEVTDHGHGIPADQLSQIFTIFHTTKHNGSGLGLAICKEIVDSHSGKLDVKSTVGEGTTFSIYLPTKEIVE